MGKPFTSDLSGQDFWTLMQTGHVPQGLVMGTCVYHIAHRGLGQTLGSAGQNVELPNFTQALYEARELAMTRMQDEANELGATGIVGVRLEEKSHQWGTHTIEFLSLGTAVTKTTDEVHAAQAHHHHLARQLMTDLTGSVDPAAPPGPAAGDLPEAPSRRLQRAPSPRASPCPTSPPACRWACEPVGFVQGFCVMQWGWYGPGSGYMRGMSPYPSRRRAAVATRRPTAARTASSRPSTAPGARTTNSRGWRRPGRRASAPPTTA